ncbi:MAG: DsbA family protein [Patescibacteria group bacterium]
MSDQNYHNKTSKQQFIFGFVTGIAAISVIGLVFLLANNGQIIKDKNLAGNTEQAAEQPGNNLPSEQPSQAGDKIEITNADHIRGDKNAPITLVEYSDFQCPYCKKFNPTMQQVMQEYSGKVRWVYRHFPLSFHQNAQKSAEASECAGEQNKFWEYSDKLFENSQADGTGLNTDDLKRYAKELGLNTSKFNDCLASGKFTSKVNADMASGQAAGISGTPGTILIDKNGNTQLISGALPYEQIKAKIDAAL